MGLVIVLIIIAIIIMTLYGRVESHLPKFLRFSHSSALSSSSDSVASEPSTPVYASVLPPAGRHHWLISIQGPNSRAVREFSTPIRAPGESYDPPLIYFSCYQNRLYAWIDTRLTAAAAPGSPGAVEVRVNGGAPALWMRQRGTTLSAPNPAGLLAIAERGGELSVSLAFDGAPAQSLLLDLKDAGPLQRAMGACAR